MNKEYQNVASYADEIEISAGHLYRILKDNGFVIYENGDNSTYLTEKGKKYGVDNKDGLYSENYVYFKKDILNDPLIMNEIDTYKKEAKNAKKHMINSYEKEGYKILLKDDSMSFDIENDEEILTVEFQTESTSNTSFLWKEKEYDKRS